MQNQDKKVLSPRSDAAASPRSPAADAAADTALRAAPVASAMAVTREESPTRKAPVPRTSHAATSASVSSHAHGVAQPGERANSARKVFVSVA